MKRAAALPRQIRTLWPVCRRLLAAGSRRNILVIALVALSLVFYSLYVSFLDVTYRESAKIIRPAALPADIVLYVPRGVTPADQEAIRSLYYLDRREWGVLGQVATNFGATYALFASSESPFTLPGAVVSGDPPLAGQCLLPQSLLGVSGAEIGAEMSLVKLAGPGAPGPGGGGGPAVMDGGAAPGPQPRTLPSAVTIAGFYAPCDPWFDMPYVVLDAAGYAAAGQPSLAFLWVHPGSNYAKKTLTWLGNRFVPAQLRVPYVAQRAELPLIMTPAIPYEWARGLERTIYFPGGEAMFLLYVFFGVGVFTLMLLAFLDRRRELAVMKTLGLTSGQVATLLYMEVLAIAAAGLVLGWGLLAAGVGPLRALTGQDYRVPPWVVGSGAFFSLLALLVSVWLPIGMARLATVANLLGGQPFHLAGYERRWSDGAGRKGQGPAPSTYSPSSPHRPSM